MSTSFVEYSGHGFWSWDGYLEHVLSLIADRIEISPKEEWLGKLRDHFRAQSSRGLRGSINPKLDEFVTSNERQEKVLGLVEGVISQPGITREAEETARLLMALLRGELNTDASSSLDYMVSGTQPYKRSVPAQNDKQK